MASLNTKSFIFDISPSVLNSYRATKIYLTVDDYGWSMETIVNGTIATIWNQAFSDSGFELREFERALGIRKPVHILSRNKRIKNDVLLLTNDMRIA